MNGFQADPEGIIKKGNTITDLYNAYMAEKKKIYETKDRVKTAWAGADSAGYATAIESYDGDFVQLGNVVAQIGDILTRHGTRLANSRDAIEDAAGRL